MRLLKFANRLDTNLLFKENVPKVNRKVTAICAAAFFLDSFPLDEIEKKSAAHRNKSHDNTA